MAEEKQNKEETMKQEAVRRFLFESNAIEREYSKEAFKDALLAWKYAVGHDLMSLHLILDIHKKLMRNLWPDIAGKWREVNVEVGSHILPKWELVPSKMSEWLINHGKAKTEEAIKQAHIAFEKIHPFRDGNGRTGRILLNWMRVKNNLPILVIKESEKWEYYKWFNETQGK